MPDIARLLITTADERTWKFDRPVVFLGEWCRIYDRRHIWSKLDAIVAAPYGLGQAKKDADLVAARMLEEKLFPVLCDVLNQYHGTQQGARFWRIVLGHWLRRYVDVLLNRVNTLIQCLQTHQISGTIAYANDHYALATQDSYAAVWAFNDERWNNALTKRILELIKTERCPIEVIASDQSSGFRWNALTSTPSLKKKVRNWGCQQAGKLASCLAKNNDAFIINSYLPKKEEIKLQLALGQCPQLWASPRLEITKEPDRALRKSLANQVLSKSENELENVVHDSFCSAGILSAKGATKTVSVSSRLGACATSGPHKLSCNLENVLSVMLLELLPVCYLEGFVGLNKLVKQLPWPKRPKFILTSNNFDTDEVFKLWAAEKAASGSTYIAGQHGNNYGTYRYMAPAIEETTADKFLTWGWTDGLPQHAPAFVFKTAGKKAEYYNPQGGLLLIEVCLTHRLTTWDGAYEFGQYFEDQQKFISELANTPKQGLTIRLHAARRYLKWNEELRWQTFDPSLKIDTGGVAIRNLIAQSRLVVHSYDSTGILETLSQNIPTLAFWQNGFDHLRDSAKPYYQLLVDVGIIHLSPESIARKVNDIWDDVNGWWAQSSVQAARKQFCGRYARLSRNPLQELKKILATKN
jgi:hypothetical protein